MGADLTPHTLHLVASLVRHGRGIATSFEKWISKQPPSPSCRELLQVSAVVRDILDKVEAQIVQFDIDLTVTETDDEHRAQVEQPTRSEASRLSSPPTLTAVK